MSVTGKVPIRDPLGLRGDIITNPQWIKWLTEQLAPAIVAINQAGLSPESLLLYRQSAGGSQAQADADSAQISASLKRGASGTESFPPQMRISPPIFREDVPLGGFPGQRPLAPWVLADTHANRANYPNSAFVIGALFVETDRLVVFRNTGTAWQYVDGIYTAALASIPTLSTTDAGFLFGVSDYGHLLRWSGTAWGFAPGDPGSGFVLEGKPDGSVPNGGPWGLCDGTAYNILQANGTTQSITTVNRTLDSFAEGSTSFGAKVATRATWETTAVTDDESAHTHQVDPPNTTSGNDSGAGTIVSAGIGATVATHTHTHDTDIAVFASGAGSAHHHVLSDAKAQLKLFSETNGGLPSRVGVSYWIRR